MIFHSPSIWPWTTHLRKSLVRKTSHAVKERLVWGLCCLLSCVHAAVYAQPGGGTVDRLLLGSFLWHESTRLKGIIQLLLAAVPPQQPYALPPPMIRGQLFWWRFEFLWGFDFLAAMFALQFLAGCLKQTEFLKFDPVNGFLHRFL